MNKDEFKAQFKETSDKIDPVADKWLVKIAASRYSWLIGLVWTLAAFAAGWMVK